MNKYLLVLAVLSTPLLAQKKIEKQLPPDYIWVKSRGLLVSINEITVKQWYEFMSNGDEKVDDYVPQPNDINKKCLCHKMDNGKVKWSEMYNVNFRDTTYVEVKNGKPGKKRRTFETCETMPITGITFERALQYCDYLNSQMESDYPHLKLKFRLPTPEEMDGLLKDTFGDWGPETENYKAYFNGINSHGCAIYNHRHNSWCDNNINMKYQYGYAVPMAVSYFFPDINGLYDLMGNVAEMTNIKGVARGGSCTHIASDCQPGINNSYNGPQFWLGFRVVADFNP